MEKVHAKLAGYLLLALILVGCSANPGATTSPAPSVLPQGMAGGTPGADGSTLEPSNAPYDPGLAIPSQQEWLQGLEEDSAGDVVITAEVNKSTIPGATAMVEVTVENKSA